MGFGDGVLDNEERTENRWNPWPWVTGDSRAGLFNRSAHWFIYQYQLPHSGIVARSITIVDRTGCCAAGLENFKRVHPDPRCAGDIP